MCMFLGVCLCACVCVCFGVCTYLKSNEEKIKTTSHFETLRMKKTNASRKRRGGNK